MQMVDGLASHAPMYFWIHHLPHDWSGTNDGDLYHDVVKTFWLQAWQTRHLRPALDLKHANGVGFLQRGIHDRIVGRQVSEIDFLAMMVADELQRIFEHGHHSQTEQIYLDDA